MRSDKALEGALEFVLYEAARFGTMPWEDLRSQLKENAFCEIQDSEGSKHLVGRKAFDLLIALTREALESSEYKGRINENSAFKAVKDAVGRNYFRKDLKSIEGAHIRRELNEALALAGEDCVDRTYFIPCSLTVPREQPVSIGPIVFRNSAAVVSELADDFDNYEESFRASYPDRDLFLLESGKEYLCSFPDIAAIRVNSCDREISENLAVDILQAALNLFHVLAGAKYTEKIRLGGPPPNKDRRALISQLADGELEISVSVHFVGGANVADGWWDGFLSDQWEVQREQFGKVLHALGARREPELLARKFLDACAWYGDAARERSSAAAIVKYLTGMECLLWANDKPFGVTKRLSARAAALCFSTETWNLFDLEQEIEEAYALRSDIVHGRAPLRDSRIIKSLSLCERISRNLILNWLNRFSLGFTELVEMDNLRTYLEKFVKEAKEACRIKTDISTRPR